MIVACLGPSVNVDMEITEDDCSRRELRHLEFNGPDSIATAV